MDNLRQMFNIIAQFSGKENTISVNTAFVRFVGEDFMVGAFLSQCTYWSDKSKRKDGFFYKSHEEWKKELFVTPHQIRRYTKVLEEMGILETKLLKANGAPTVHYRILTEEFTKQFIAFLTKEAASKEEFSEEEEVNNQFAPELIVQTLENTGMLKKRQSNVKKPIMECEKNQQSLTKNTTKNTTEIKKDIVEQSSTPSIPFFEIIDYLNQQTGKRFKAEGSANRKLIKARWNEGYKLEDFKHVVDVKVEEWINTDFEKYLVPGTLFSNKFEKYVNQSFKKKSATNKTTNSADYNMEDYY